ncbi:hypothetical protein BAC_4556 [Bacillus anthracis str. A0488]|uniref:Uncharacterized protein n=1 Tax=Bacillus anthracis TaxID=1392 RepID=Q81LQ3_BACAN|nr:hypothetical protein GBAA_4559 [Bacillus anthracis str. 'Ames Ancestor']EDR16573.1 hypothetical protein BAC_4556 [Bacillus anthracis str. A0488]EDR88898.1 hypothetical protein BAQ_4585 [Bacillus anthracis str. A0193]EDR92756.1 hypothetical protein BAH_4612 [Bacillus anthracis str. A0442]EDS96515.1 hypothetical protein BAK_4640 [Bacillus anthracis str. A0389]EDT19339.1 hypothetical protein BAM_4620 [Bacillus anthracis str. A0465]EDT66609.1 hypothetical protein BAO_4540 [Bacillus anthracis s
MLYVKGRGVSFEKNWHHWRYIRSATLWAFANCK